MRQSDGGEDVVELEKASEEENKKQCEKKEERKRTIELQFHGTGQVRKRQWQERDESEIFGTE